MKSLNENLWNSFGKNFEPINCNEDDCWCETNNCVCNICDCHCWDCFLKCIG